MSKCSKCKKDIQEEFTSSDFKIICQNCLEQEIYKERYRIYKKDRKEKLRKIMNQILIGIFIGFGISYITVMFFLLLKVIK